MLLSQQAELISIKSNMVEIGLARNWENMIKSRAVVIEDAVKKIFGEHMTISFKSQKNNKNKISDKGNNISKKSINSTELENIEHKNNNSQLKDSKFMSNESLSNNSLDIEESSSKNLANFFNGQIVDTEKE